MISPSSPLAVLIASLVVCASGDVASSERNQSGKVIYVSKKLSSPTRKSWISAITNDDTSRLSELLRTHNPASLLAITASNGKSALMVAAKKGDLKLAKVLVYEGADVNEPTETQGTPFMFAIVGGQQEAAQWLLEQGADVNTVGSNGWTALTIAAAKGQVHLLQWLIGEGADAQVRDVYRFTPLLRAVENGHVEAAAVLLSLVDTDVNALDENDNTALHFAVSQGRKDLVTLLLTHQADPNLLNKEGLSAMDLARSLADDTSTILRAMKDATLP